ncbi:MAG: hypothetical protein OXI67_09735 [Candidatus Poribacteria bacterium]|nr:hypothetical protein [Candidatus Poribacteria bacterium]
MSQTDASAQTEETPEVRVSKFGFGPYPEIPPDFPYPDLFDPQDHPYYADDPNHPYKDNPNYELSYRVWVELWKRGEKVNGTYSSGGLLYPAYPDTVYVEWIPRWTIFGFGIGRKIRSMTGPAAVGEALNAHRQLGRPLLESDIPDGIKILDKSESGIDPYEFLDLPKPK